MKRPKVGVPRAALEERKRIIALARKLGDELVENGKDLAKMEVLSPEGRLRQLVGMLFHDLASCLYYETKSEAHKAVMAALERCKQDPSTVTELIEIMKDAKRYERDGGCSW